MNKLKQKIVALLTVGISILPSVSYKAMEVGVSDLNTEVLSAEDFQENFVAPEVGAFRTSDGYLVDRSLNYINGSGKRLSKGDRLVKVPDKLKGEIKLHPLLNVNELDGGKLYCCTQPSGEKLIVRKYCKKINKNDSDSTSTMPESDEKSKQSDEEIEYKVAVLESPPKESCAIYGKPLSGEDYIKYRIPLADKSAYCSYVIRNGQCVMKVNPRLNWEESMCQAQRRHDLWGDTFLFGDATPEWPELSEDDNKFFTAYDMIRGYKYLEAVKRDKEEFEYGRAKAITWLTLLGLGLATPFVI